MTCCQRCFAASPVTLKGALSLCATCELTPSCGEFSHAYAGHTNGLWVCLACGETLSPQAVDYVAPQAPPALFEDYGC